MNTKDHAVSTERALDLALEALEELNETNSYWWQEVDEATAKKIDPAITAIKQARSAPVLDSTCNETLRAQGKAYPRTCRKCGLGPCIGAPKQPPAAPVQQKPLFADIIAQHPGLAEELKAMDEGFELGYKAGLAAAHRPVALPHKWVGLTNEDFIDLCEDASNFGTGSLIRHIEAKLKEKNNG
jgi:hypothetical protein